MKKILCYIYNGMADFEITLLLYRLRNTGNMEIITIAESLDILTSDSGLKYKSDILIEDAFDIDADAIIIPGGDINDNNCINDLLNKMIDDEKLVCAICFGPQFLGRAGILDSYKFTTSCSEQKIAELGIKDPFNRKNYIEDRYVVDRNVITAKGYAFVDFTLAVLDYFDVFEDSTQRYNQILKIKE